MYLHVTNNLYIINSHVEKSSTGYSNIYALIKYYIYKV